MEAGGVSIHGVGFLLIWWRKLGTLWTTALLLAVSAPVGGCAVLTSAATHAIPDWIGDFGVQFEARDWDVHPFSLSAEAHDVTLRRDAHSDPVFTATSIEFSGSLATLLAGVFSRGAVYNEILIRHGEVLVEQSLTGDWNWHQFLEAVPADRRRDALAGLYRIKELRADDLRLTYTEHVPGNSGGGVIQTSQATIYVDAVQGSIMDLARPAGPDARPTAIQFKARTADGIIEVKGEAALFLTDVPDAGPGMVTTSIGGTGRIAPPGEATGLTGPMFSMRVYLENIGVGAYARMVPTTTIMPVKGTLRGTIEMVRSPSQGFACRSNIAADGVEFAPNPRMVPVRDQFDRIQRELVGYRVSGTYDACALAVAREPRGPALQRAGTGSGLLASFNVQTTRDASLGVRAITAYDQQQLAGGLTDGIMTSLNRQLGAAMAREVSRLLGPQSGLAMQQAFAADGLVVDPEAGDDNAVAGGVRTLGRGLKRLFGGGR